MRSINALFPFIFGFLLVSSIALKAQDFQPDLSMSMSEFETKALDSKDEVWVVDFWASWCRPCIMSIPHLKEVASQYSGKPVRFISISWDEAERNWMNAQMHLKMPWQQILIPDIKADHPFLDKNFPHTGIPAIFIIHTNGKVKKVADVYKVEKAIEKALK